MSSRPEKLGRYRVSWAADGTATVHDVPVFERVSRAGREYDTSWLVGAVNRFADERKSGFRPALHVGHCRDEFDEKPACGFLDRLRVDRGKLFGDFAHVQPETFGSLARGEYPYVSVEAWHGKGKLKSVALLGSSPPQIKASPLHIAEGFREYETFRERGTGKEPGELVDRFIVRAFARDGFRAATLGGDIDIFQATREAMMAMQEGMMPEGAKAADEGGELTDEQGIPADFTIGDLKELIVATILNMSNEEEEGEEKPEGEPAPAVPATFSEKDVGEFKAVLDRMAEQVTARDEQITKLVGENRAAKINVKLTALRAEGYRWKPSVLQLFTEQLNAQDESKWDDTFAVLKDAGERSVGPVSPLDFGASAPSREVADSFKEALNEKTKDAKTLAEITRAASALMNAAGV